MTDKKSEDNNFNKSLPITEESVSNTNNTSGLYSENKDQSFFGNPKKEKTVSNSMDQELSSNKKNFLNSLFELIDQENFKFNISNPLVGNGILIEFKTEKKHLLIDSKEVEEKLQALVKIFRACLSEIDKNCRLVVNLDEGSQTLKILKVNDNNRVAINNFLQTAFEHCKDIEHNEKGCVIC